MIVQSYLSFDGRTEEALEFYKTVLGATVTVMMRFGDSPDPASQAMMKPGTEKKIMHANFQIGETQLMASDGECGGSANFQGISLALTIPDAATAERVFAALSEGGQVRMPLTKTFFSSHFGMLEDKFGVGWMIMVSQ